MTEAYVLGKPFAGWSKINLGGIETPPCSYLTNVPMDLLTFFCNWFEDNNAVIDLDFESEGLGTFSLSNVSLRFNHYDIERYRRLDLNDIISSAELFSKNIADDLDVWSLWHIEQYEFLEDNEYESSIIIFLDGFSKLKNYLKMCGKDIKYCDCVLKLFKDVANQQRNILIEEHNHIMRKV